MEQEIEKIFLCVVVEEDKRLQLRRTMPKQLRSDLIMLMAASLFARRLGTMYRLLAAVIILALLLSYFRPVAQAIAINLAVGEV